MWSRRVAVIAAAVVTLTVVVALVVWALGDDGQPSDAASPQHSTSSPGPDAPTDGAEPGEDDTGDGQAAGAGPLAVDEAIEPAVDDQMALDTYCSLDPDVLDAMPRPPGGGDVDPDALRDALVLLSDRKQEWSFAAFGRPGFESLLTVVDEVGTQWQAAMDAFDSGETDTANDRLADADAAIAELRERLEAEAVDCP